MKYERTIKYAKEREELETLGRCGNVERQIWTNNWVFPSPVVLTC